MSFTASGMGPVPVWELRSHATIIKKKNSDLFASLIMKDGVTDIICPNIYVPENWFLVKVILWIKTLGSG